MWYASFGGGSGRPHRKVCGGGHSIPTIPAWTGSPLAGPYRFPGKSMRLVIPVMTGALLGMLAGLVASWISIPTTVVPGTPDRCCAALIIVPPLFGSFAGGVAAYYRHRYGGGPATDSGRRAVRSRMRRRRRH